MINDIKKKDQAELNDAIMKANQTQMLYEEKER